MSFRLMEALRRAGHDARMLVGRKLSDSPFVEQAGHPLRHKAAFLAEHLEIFLSNGLSRKRLFQASTARWGLPLASHPLVRQADAVILGWVNQGLLSLGEAAKIARSRPTLWVMHDMWNFTGICHHAGACRRWQSGCGHCPLLGREAFGADLSHSTFRRKMKAYDSAPFTFVAVSSWLKSLALSSPLMSGHDVELIHNPFPVEDFMSTPIDKRKSGQATIIMGAARLDDPVKGLPLAIEALNILYDRGYGNKVKVVFFGALRNPDALKPLRLEYRHMGTVSNPEELRRLYAEADIVLSSSLYETLPGTLIEGQAAGCYPVSFGRGGQRDIIDHPSTGYLASSPEGPLDPIALADGLEYAILHSADPSLLRTSVAKRFASDAVAARYLEILGVRR